MEKEQETYHPHWQDVIKSYFKANGFVKHQTDSFNEFVEVGIQKILNEVGSIEIKTSKESRGGEATYIIEFGQISIKKPVIREHDGTTNVLYPQEARDRNLTYHSSLYCDIKVKTIKNGEETFKVSKEQLGYIPIMLKSKFCLLYGKTEKECKDIGECKYDEGGYFIVNGNEKVIIAQERMPNNIVYCFYKKPPSKIIWQAEIRSQFEYHIKTTSTFYIRIFAKGSRSVANSNPTFTDIDGIRGQITYIKQDIPIIFIFHALGYTSKNEIIDIVTNAKIPIGGTTDDQYFKNILKFLRCSFDEANEIIKEENTEELDRSELQEFCLDYIGKKGSTMYGSKAERVKYATQIINRELLPHLNLEYEAIFETELQITKTKAHFIGYMVNKLYASYLGTIKENDRDHLANKRLDLTGNLLTTLFKGIFKRLYKEAKVNLTKSIESNNSFDLMNNIKSKSITNDIKYALSTGNWGRQTGGTPPKTGVAQQLNRLTFSSALSHLRRVNTPLNREGKQAKPRQLHATSWSYICPCETPEGASCGLLRNLAITCHVSIGSNRTFVILKKFFEKYVLDKFIEKREMITETPLYKVFLDGAWVVSVDEPMVTFLVGKLKKFRRKLMISFDTCVCLDKESKELHIFTGPGRFCRPLLVVENIGQLNEETKDCTWIELLSKGIVEYIDIAEEEEIMIAMNLKQLNKNPEEYTHLEIHPSVILGICASIIPFAQHNQAPRNIYQSCKMCTLVSMANGSKKQIKDVVVGDIIVSWNKDTLERVYARVLDHYVKPNVNKAYKITTVSGREITATEDHHFWTNRGFMEIGDIIKAIAENPEIDTTKVDREYDAEHTIDSTIIKGQRRKLGILTDANGDANEIEILVQVIYKLEYELNKMNGLTKKYGKMSPEEQQQRAFYRAMFDKVKKYNSDMSKLRINPNRTDVDVNFNPDDIYTIIENEIDIVVSEKVVKEKNQVLLAVNLFSQPIYQDLTEQVTILTELQLSQCCDEHHIAIFDKYRRELNRFIGQIDLSVAKILAGIVGHLLTDGSINVKIGGTARCSFCTGSLESANEILNDLELIGFVRKTPVYRESIMIKDGVETIKRGYNIGYTGSTAFLFVALGTSLGKRVNHEMNIQDWILNGHREIKRSFLSTLFGGDGSKMRYNISKDNTYIFTFNTFSRSKIKDEPLIRNLEEFMENISGMLLEFGVETNYIHRLEGDYDYQAVHLGMKQTQENMIKFYEEIGYKYDNYKHQESGMIIEYLKHRKYMSKEKFETINQIRAMIDEGKSNSVIAKKFDKKTSTISDIRKAYKNNRTLMTRKEDSCTIDEWEKMTVVKNNTIFVPIDKIVYDPSVEEISDITVEIIKGNSPAFIANDFLIHNSSMGIHKRRKTLN